MIATCPDEKCGGTIPWCGTLGGVCYKCGKWSHIKKIEKEDKRLLKADEKIEIHDDGCGTILDKDGKCPKCGFHPDMQSRAFESR